MNFFKISVFFNVLMEDIRYQLEIYRVEFNKENELAYVESQKEEIDELFKNEGTLYCKYNI